MMRGKTRMALVLFGGAALATGAIAVRPPLAAAIPAAEINRQPEAATPLRLAQRSFVSEAGRFAIVAPGTLTESVQPVDLGFTTVDMYTYAVEYNDSYWAVHYNDYPPEIMTDADPAVVLDAATAAMADELGGTIVADEPLTLEGYPGREIVVETDSLDGSLPLAIKVRLYLVGNRFYQVMVGYPQAATNQMTAIDNYLESFELL
jgi:hypothetical protein